jgi:predicted esterase
MKPSQVQEQVLEPDDECYTIAIPQKPAVDEPLPLILALHYAGHGMPFFGRLILEDLIEPAWRELGAIVVAPDCPARDWIQPESEALVLRLLEHLQDNYPVDPHRMLIAGYSMGGNGAWHLAARHQDRFAAAVIMAGWPTVKMLDVRWQTPLYVIHSRADELVPLEVTEPVVQALQDQGAPVELVVLEDAGHYETGRFVAPLRAAIPWIRRAWAVGES